MVLPRNPALRASLTSRLVRPALNMRAANAQRWQRAFQRNTQRGYASMSEPIKKAGSDLPWLVSAIVVTIPGCWYILQPSSSGHGDEHGHGKEDDPNAVQHPVGEGDEGKSGFGGSKSNELEKPQNEPIVEGESASKDEEHIVETPESKGNVEGVQFKGATKQGGDDKAAPDTRKHVPDAKGGAKKRIESGYGVPQGVPEDTERDGEGKVKDKAASSKSSGDQNTTSGKQAGLDNADTKHSTDLASNPEKSTKGEGTVESAKLQGSVDPRRPPAEQKDDKKSDKA